MKVTKAIIPVAGFGTRFLPQTKAMPKEMLPIVDKPTVQIIVEQFVKAGIKDIILVTGWHKRAIEDHFDTHPELEALLQETGKTKMLEELRSITNLANFIFIRQKGPRGNATPITNALSAIGDTEPYLVSWGDDILISETPMATQLIQAHEKYGGIILGSMKMDKPEDGKKYGFATGKEVEPGVWAFFSGDINQDGYVDGMDYGLYDDDFQNNVSGTYVATDLNGDGYVDNFDYGPMDTNTQNNVTISRP